MAIFAFAFFAGAVWDRFYRFFGDGRARSRGQPRAIRFFDPFSSFIAGIVLAILTALAAVPLGIVSLVLVFGTKAGIIKLK